MKFCPWCGRLLELKVLDAGTKFRHVCSRCGWKIKEFAKPAPTAKQEKQQDIPIRPEEVPVVKPKPAWPFILSAVILILIAIILVRVLLV